MVPVWLKAFTIVYLMIYSTFTKKRFFLSYLKDCYLSFPRQVSSHQEAVTVFDLLEKFTPLA